MKRREFIKLLGGAAVAWPLAVRAQQTTMPVIGALMNISENDPSAPVFIAAFREQLQGLGWTDGRNVRIEVRWAGAGARYRDYAAELAVFAPAIVLASTTPAVTAMRNAAPTVPVVFVQAIDPVGSGLVTSLARPGANATGFTRWSVSLSQDTSQPRVVADPGMRRSLSIGNREISIAVPTSRGRDRVGKAGGRSRR